MPASYDQLASKMRVEPTFAIAEEVIKKDFKLKLPSRTAIHIWNSPEISQFRGYQEELDNVEDRKHTPNESRRRSTTLPARSARMCPT